MPRSWPRSLRDIPPIWRRRGVVALGLVALLFAAWGAIVALRTPTGTIIVENLPDDAEVLVDGNAITLNHGDETVTIEALPTGKHRIQVTRDGRPSWTNDVTIEFAGQKVPVRYVLPFGEVAENKAAQKKEYQPPKNGAWSICFP